LAGHGAPRPDGAAGCAPRAPVFPPLGITRYQPASNYGARSARPPAEKRSDRFFPPVDLARPQSVSVPQAEVRKMQSGKVLSVIHTQKSASPVSGFAMGLRRRQRGKQKWQRLQKRAKSSFCPFLQSLPFLLPSSQFHRRADRIPEN